MLHVLTKDGKKLFSGTRHDVKQYLRKNKIKSYVIKERFVEKMIVTDSVDEFNEVFPTPEEYFDE